MVRSLLSLKRDSKTKASNGPPTILTEPVEPDAGIIPLDDHKNYSGSGGTVSPVGSGAAVETKEADTKAKEKGGWFSAIGWFIVDQWFLVGIGVLALVASQVQVPASGQKAKQTAVEYTSVSLIFFITGCTLPTKVLLQNAYRWKLHLFVQVQCYLLTSAIIFGIVSLCATNRNFMDPALLVGLIFAGCVPTTISSNVVMTRQAHGNSALTVVESTLGNFLGPFLTPVLVSMYTSTGAWYTDFLPHNKGGYGEIYKRVFKQLGLSLFLPLFVGQVVQNMFPKATKKVLVDWKLNKLGSFCLLAIIWQTYDGAFESGAFSTIKASNKLFIVFISIALYPLYLAICFLTSTLWLSKSDTIAVAYCVPAKTPAMGVPLITTMYVGLSMMEESKIQIPLVIYQGFQIAFGSVLTVAFRKWILPEEQQQQQQQQKQKQQQQKQAK